MKYLLLIYSEETNEDMPQDVNNLKMQEYDVYTKSLISAGVIVGGEALLPTATASTVQVRGKDKIVKKGSYAETKEQISGYYVLECESLEEAVEWAAKCPDAKNGIIEVRPILSFEKPH
jgi:hypothetical protein